MKLSSPKKDVSIIIPTFNRRNDIKKCLKSLKKINYDSFEIIVVDDGNDDTEKMILSEFPYVNYIKNNKRLGVSESKNIGIQQSRGRFVWFLDSDSLVVNSNTLSNMMIIMKENLDVGSIGGEIITHDGKKVFRSMSFIDSPEIYPYDVVMSNPNKFELMECDYLPTCNCLIRKKDVEYFQGFDETYFYGFEDADLASSLKSIGYKNMWDPRTSVYHTRSDESRTSNFDLLAKNEIKFVIINCSIKIIFLYPIINARKLVQGFIALKKMNTENIKSTTTGRGNVLLLVYGYIIASIKAYIVNILNLPNNLERRKRKRYLIHAYNQNKG